MTVGSVKNRPLPASSSSPRQIDSPRVDLRHDSPRAPEDRFAPAVGRLPMDLHGLAAAAPARAAAGPVSIPPTGLAFDEGQTYQPDVEILQRALVAAGYLGEQDMETGPGYYGNRTRAAVQHLQSDYGIQSDGAIFGPRSRDALMQALSRSSSSGAAQDADALAQQIAQEATGWTYDYEAPKTFAQGEADHASFDRTHQGICVDMALEAADEFKANGVNAEVVIGQTRLGGHAWVEYQESNGAWTMFDPTAAACTKEASTAINPMSNGLYGYGQVEEVDPV